MERVRQILMEARVQEDKEGRPEIAYFRYLAAVFGTADVLAKLVLFSPIGERDLELEGKEVNDDQDDGNDVALNIIRGKLIRICRRASARAELLLPHVIEYSGGDLEELRSSGTQIAGRGCEPLLAQPIKIFAEYPEMVQQCTGSTKTAPPEELSFAERFAQLKGAEDSHVPAIPESRLALFQYALLYHGQLLLQKMSALEEKPAKDQANAVFLACLNHTLDDLEKVMDRKLFLEQAMLDVQALELRNEFLSPKDTAEQIYLIGRQLWRRVRPADIPTSRMQAHGSIAALMDWQFYLVRWAQREVVLGGDARERAHNIVYLLCIADALVERHGDYAAAGAIASALNSDLIGRLRQTVQLLPRKAVVRLETLVKVTGPEKDHARCREAVSKHRHPLPSTPMILADARKSGDPKRQRENGQLVDRVIGYSLQAVEKHLAAIRLDIQHWILTRPFLNDQQIATLVEMREPSDRDPPPQKLMDQDLDLDANEEDGRSSGARSPAPTPLPPPVDKSDLSYAGSIIPQPRQSDLEALADLDSDRIGIVIGQHQQW